MLSSVCLSYFSILFYDAKLILFSENTKHLGKKTYRNRMESQNETNKPATADGIHTLTLTPNDPAIIFEKIVIDGREGKGRVKVI